MLVYAVDRLSRNQNHVGVLFDEIQAAGTRLAFVTEAFEDTAVGRFILAARAFVAEVEREKIVERTTRGKNERARSGRLPQGTGRGMYGYLYSAATGMRTIHLEQSAVVQRLFRDFARGVSLVALTNQLNAEGIPTLSGSIWFPITVHRLLRNESYTGRTVYRRSTIVRSRHPVSGRKQRRTVQRDKEEWIEVPNATPAIIEPTLFAAVRAILDDPERTRQAQRLNEYPLTGRMRCPLCGHAMVGQALRPGRYRYYECPRAYAGPKQDRCSAGYVRANELETAVRAEIAQLLSDPAVVLAEMERQQSPDGNVAEREAFMLQSESLEGQRRRLAKLYQLGEIDDAYLEAESKALRSRREVLETRLDEIGPAKATPRLTDFAALCSAVRHRFEKAAGGDFDLLLEALDIRIQARADHGELTGVLPAYAPANRHADVRPMVIIRACHSPSP